MTKTKFSPTPREVGAAVAVAQTFLTTMCEKTGDWTLGVSEVNLLLALYVNGRVYQQDLGKYTGLEKSANSRHVAKLGPGERPLDKPGPGYVHSEPDLANRRMNHVSLTQRGRALVEAAAAGAAFYLPKPPTT